MKKTLFSQKESLRSLLKKEDYEAFFSVLPHYLKICDANDEFLKECFKAFLNKSRKNLKKYLSIAVQYQPKNFYLLTCFSSVYIMEYQYDKAEHYLKRALEQDPSDSGVLTNLSIVYSHNGLLDKTIEVSRLVLEQAPDNIIVKFQVASAYCHCGNYDKAKGIYAELMQKVRSVDNVFNYYHTSFLSGDTSKFENIEELFLKYRYSKAAFFLFSHFFMKKEEEAIKKAWYYLKEWRKKEKFGLSFNTEEVNSWQGEILEGKTILVQLEQGKGDIINFGRFLKNILDQNPSKVFVAFRSKEEKELVESFSFYDSNKISFYTNEKFHYHSSLLLIPAQLNLSIKQLSQQKSPYLKLEETYEKKWTKEFKAYQSAFKIALVWRGNPSYVDDCRRSMKNNEIFDLLFESKRIKFFSFQFGVDLKVFPSSLIDLTKNIESFKDTIAALNQCDLVISVDTALAHLGGALNKETFLLLSHNAEWRWGDYSQARFFWYPKMKIFRQEQVGDWLSLVKKIKVELEKL